MLPDEPPFLPYPIAPFPMPDEEIQGYLRRFAAANGFSSFGSLRREAKLGDISATSPPDRWQRLCRITGLQPHRFDPLRSVTLNGRPGLTDMCGQTVNFGHVAHRMRICPACIADAPDDASRILRRYWSLTYVVACPRHRTMLIDRCDDPTCGRELSLRAEGSLWSCECGRSFASMTVDAAPRGAMSLVEAVVAHANLRPTPGKVSLASRKALPKSARQLELGSLLTLVHVMGQLATRDPAQDLIRPSRRLHYSKDVAAKSVPLDVATTRVVAAMAMMSDWPRSFWSTLDGLYAQNAHLPGQPIEVVGGSEQGQLALNPIRSSAGKGIAMQADAIEAWHRDRFGTTRLRPKGAAALQHRFWPSKRVPQERDGVTTSYFACTMLEGTKGGKFINAWKEAGLLTCAGQGFYIRNVLHYVERLRTMPDRRDAAGASLVKVSEAGPYMKDYRRPALLRDVFDGTLPAWREPNCSTFPDLFVDAKRLASLRHRALVRRQIESGIMLPVNRLADRIEEIWGRRISPDGNELAGLASAGRISVREIPVVHRGRTWTLYLCSLCDTVSFLLDRTDRPSLFTPGELIEMLRTPPLATS